MTDDYPSTKHDYKELLESLAESAIENTGLESDEIVEIVEQKLQDYKTQEEKAAHKPIGIEAEEVESE